MISYCGPWIIKKFLVVVLFFCAVPDQQHEAGEKEKNTLIISMREDL